MNKHFYHEKRPRQVHIDLLYSIYELAISRGYVKREAKRVALYALERKVQGGFIECVRVIERIIAKKQSANPLVYFARDFDRLVEGRNPKNLNLQDWATYDALQFTQSTRAFNNMLVAKRD